MQGSVTQEYCKEINKNEVVLFLDFFPPVVIGIFYPGL